MLLMSKVFVTFNIPVPVFKMPAPLPPGALPPKIVRSDMLTVPVVVTWKMRTLTPVAGVTNSLSAPGPTIDKGWIMSDRALVSSMTHKPAEQEGSDAGISNLIMLLELPAFACRIAPRSEQSAGLPPWVEGRHAPATTVSEVFPTTIGRVTCAFCGIARKPNTMQAKTGIKNARVDRQILATFLFFDTPSITVSCTLN